MRAERRKVYGGRRRVPYNSGLVMAGYAVLYTAVFSLYSVMEVLGLMPQEIRSAGLTLPAVLSSHYGDQVGKEDFVQRACA